MEWEQFPDNIIDFAQTILCEDAGSPTPCTSPDENLDYEYSISLDDDESGAIEFREFASDDHVVPAPSPLFRSTPTRGRKAVSSKGKRLFSEVSIESESDAARVIQLLVRNEGRKIGMTPAAIRKVQSIWCTWFPSTQSNVLTCLVNARTRDIDDVPESELQVCIDNWVTSVGRTLSLQVAIKHLCVDFPISLTQRFTMGRSAPIQLIVQASVVIERALRHPQMDGIRRQALAAMGASPTEYDDLAPVLNLRYRPHRMREELRSPHSAREKPFPILTHESGRTLPKAPKQKRLAISALLQKLLEQVCSDEEAHTAPVAKTVKSDPEDLA